MERRRPVGLGVVGCGNIAQKYLGWIAEAYADQLRVVACTDVDAGRARETAARCGCAAVLDSAALVARADVQIVLNFTSPMAHTAVTLEALAADKHVYSEKPLALSLADADRIVAEARARGLVVACAPAAMLGAPQRAAWEWVREGRLGTIHEVVLTATTPGHEAWHPSPRYYYQAGAGPLLDIGVYPLTVATTLLGPIARVWGQAGIAIAEREVATGPRAGERFAVEVPDHVTGLLQFESGTIGTIHASFAVAKTTLPAVEVHGTAGSLWLSDKQSYAAVVRVCLRGEKDWRDIAIVGAEEAPNWAAGIADVVAAVGEGRGPRLSAEQAAHVLEVMIGVERSADEGGCPVAITRRFTASPPHTNE
jgi:predicted dehydrogenase